MNLVFGGRASWPIADPYFVGRVVRDGPATGSASSVLVTDSEELLRHAAGYRAIITSRLLTEGDLRGLSSPCPVYHEVSGLGSLQAGHIIGAFRGQPSFRILYRPESHFNVIFATARCNSNCIMCSQPASDRDDGDLVPMNIELIGLIEEDPPVICISGGEPTLLGDDLLKMLAALKDKFPSVPIHMLTNGRRFSDLSYAREFRTAAPDNISVGIPLYSAFQDVHDYIVQAPGAFDQTTSGFHNLARVGVPLEIRVVLLRDNVLDLSDLGDYIYRNVTFAGHVAFMGLEPQGHALANMTEVWIDPLDYAEPLECSVRFLALCGFRVSIYNLPLCVVPESIRKFCRQSISDYKNVFIEECALCVARDRCAGFFALGKRHHSRGVLPLSSI